jgi:hypothetical protein
VTLAAIPAQLMVMASHAARGCLTRRSEPHRLVIVGAGRSRNDGMGLSRR